MFLVIKNIILLLLITYIFLKIGYSQGIGINNTNSPADPSAGIDINFSDKGLLLPRLTTTERNNINSPAQSLLIYNITDSCYQSYIGIKWQNIWCACSFTSQIPNATYATNITDSSFIANWNIALNATSYNLDVSTELDFSSFLPGYNNLNVSNVTIYTITGLHCNTTYYYRLRSSNNCGSSAFSNTISLTTSICSISCDNSFIDSRDGQSYPSVLIGTQCWMAKNLNYSTSGLLTPSSTGQGAVGTQKYCYGDLESNCNIYGGLYQWPEMMNDSASCNGLDSTQPACNNPVQGICPPGWHIPSHYEWVLLERNSGSNPYAFPYDTTTFSVSIGSNEGCNLKEDGTLHWISPNQCCGSTCNSTGFNALPGGDFWVAGAPFNNLGYNTHFWCSTQYTNNYAFVRYLCNSFTIIIRNIPDKLSGMSVRCLKD